MDEVIFNLANEGYENDPLSIKLERMNHFIDINKLFKSKSFNQQDIEYLKFVEYAESQGQQAMDLVYVGHNLSMSLSILHISVGVMNEELSDYDRDIVVATYRALERMG